MFAMPDAAQLVELAAALDLRLSPQEAELYLPVIIDAMRELDGFVQSRADEAAPLLLFPERAAGYRPSLAEDRYRPGSGSVPSVGPTRGCLLARR